MKKTCFINTFLFLPCFMHLETASAWLVLILRSDVNRKNLASILVRDTRLEGREKYAAVKSIAQYEKQYEEI